jgi:hypothetical protein
MSVFKICGAFFVLLVGCACAEAPSIDLDTGQNGEGEGEGEGEEAAATIDDVVAAWSAVSCAVYACEHRTRQTPAICADAADADGTPFAVIPFAADELAAGDATFDVDAATRCLALLATLGDSADACFGPDALRFDEAWGEDFADSCGRIAVGALAVGDACVSDRQCAGETRCLLDDVFQGCGRSCRVVLGEGDACAERPSDCDDATTCDGAVCVSRNLIASGNQCFSNESCVSGKCFNFVCREKSEFDGECIAEGDCQFGQFCRPLPPSTGLVGICQTPSPTGGECGFAVQCDGNQSCPGFAIRNSGGNQNGICAATMGDVGDVCVPIADGFDRGDSGCFADLICDKGSARCAEAPAIGDACADGLCGFAAYCDDEDTCQRRVGVGEAATDVDACFEHGFVQGGVCNDFDGNSCPSRL